MIVSQDVTKIFLDCLFKDYQIEQGIPKDIPIIVEGITMNVGFHPDNLNKNLDKIGAMIDELHPTFDEGWSFLSLCTDKDNEMWTSQHKVMEELTILGLAAKRLEYCADRDMWNMMPAGMPYIRRIKHD